MQTLLIKNGTLVTASETVQTDILIKDGRIDRLGFLTSSGAEIVPADEVIDATGKYVMPGGIDVHTHIDMPLGDIRTADDFESGTCAAACGGTTTIIDYAAQSRGESMAQGLETWMQMASGKAVIDYGFHLTLAEFTERTFADMEQMVALGAPSFKVFTAYPNRLMLDDAAIFRVLQHAARIGGLVCAHAENGPVIEALIQDALAAGHVEPKYHALTRPPELEAEAVHRLITLAELARAPLYIVHVSSNDALQEIITAQRRGALVYAETCPQYLVLSDENYERLLFEGAKYVMSPPLRSKSHQAALWQGLHSQAVFVIGTDHCPFYFNTQKVRGKDNFTKIPNGAPGIETRLAVLYTEGVCTGRISLNQFVALVATNPAKLFGLYPQKGTIAPGSDADVIIVDPTAATIISAVTHHSCVDYSLYEGQTVKGMPETVLFRGNVIVQQGRFVGARGAGQFLKRKPYASTH
jgi:dihydropyrimidinase